MQLRKRQKRKGDESLDSSYKRQKPKFNPKTVPDPGDYTGIEDSSDSEDDYYEESQNRGPEKLLYKSSENDEFNDHIKEMWKDDLPEQEVERLEPEMKKIREEIDLGLPTIPKILSSGMSMDEKCYAVQVYDIWMKTECNTFEYLSTKEKLIEMIGACSENSDTSIIDNSLNELRKKMKFPTIEKIMKARIGESDRIRAIQLFDGLKLAQSKTDDSWEYIEKINLILKNQFATDEELMDFEKQESLLKAKSVNYLEDLRRKILILDADDSIKIKLYDMYREMSSMDASTHDYSSLKTKLVGVLKLPFRKIIKPSFDVMSSGKFCVEVYKKLNREMYGMDKVKLRLVEMINNRLSNPESRGIIALKGEAGVGKTKIISLISEVAGLPFRRITLGGYNDNTIFKGSDSVWSGSTCSMLLQTLGGCKCSNPIIFIDEVDKISKTDRGKDVENSLLHILDKSQNKDFLDSYFTEFSHDLSKVWFFLAMNRDDELGPELKDRLDIIEVPSYKREDKCQILMKYSFPRELKELGLTGQVSITEDACYYLIDKLSDGLKESGMRLYETGLAKILNKINLFKSLQDVEESDTIPIRFRGEFKLPLVITSENIDWLMETDPKEKIWMSFYT